LKELRSTQSSRNDQFFRLGKSRDTGENVEAHIETQNLLDAVPFHDCQVHGITGGQASAAENSLFGALHHGAIDGQSFFHQLQQRVLGRLDGIETIDRWVAIQNFPQDLCVGHQATTLTK
jgi:hypothetical protein